MNSADHSSALRSRSRENYIKYLTIFSAFCVVMIHFSGTFHTFSYERRWLTANVVESVCYFAVPAFFMISGATLLDYNERYSTRDFFKKRASKTVIPYLFWCFFALLFLLAFGNVELSSLTWKDVVAIWSSHKYQSIYYFFFGLFTCYLCIPVLAQIPKEKRQKTFAYVIFSWFFICGLFPLVFKLLELPWDGGLTMPLASGYIIYLLTGYCINSYDISRRLRMLIYALGIFGLLLIFFGTWYYSYRDGEVNSIFKSYTGVPCYLYSVAIFTFFKYMQVEKFPPWIRKFTDFFAGKTFGIYLIHIYLKNASVWLLELDAGSIYFRIFGGIAAFFVSAVIVALLQKIPFVKKVIPC